MYCINKMRSVCQSSVLCFLLVLSFATIICQCRSGLRAYFLDPSLFAFRFTGIDAFCTVHV